MENSHVAMATKQCPVCLEIHSHNTEILLNTRLRPIEENQTYTGHGLCKEHDRLFKDGYIALIAVEDTGQGDTISQKDAVRTGHIAHLKRHVFDDMFDTELPDKQEMVFVDEEIINMLEKMKEEEQDE